MECLLPHLCMVSVPHIMVRLERMLDYRRVGLERFHCTSIGVYKHECLGRCLRDTMESVETAIKLL